MARHQTITLRSGLKLSVDLESAVQSTIFWYDGDMEPQLSWAVRELLPVGGTLVDCGANCGFVGLEARLRKGASVLFIEPHPELAKSIQRNIELNGWRDSCRLIQAAASDRAEISQLFVCETYDGSHSLLSDWWHNPGETRALQIEVKPLSTLLDSEPRFQTVSFLKVDTEGNDFAVLKGLGSMLDPARIGVIYAELARDREPANRLLEERGYSGFGYRPLSSGKVLRRELRKYGNGEMRPFFYPLHDCSRANETLWVAKGGVQETFLLELAAVGRS